MDLTTIKTITDIAQSIATIAAFIVGGAWTYKLFLSKRESIPRIDTKHLVDHTLLPENKYLVHIHVIVNNTGNVYVQTKSMSISLCQISPMSPKLLKEMQKGFDTDQLINSDARLHYIEKEFDYEIIPGESTEWSYIFLVDSNIQIIEIQTLLQSKKHEVAWVQATLCDLRQSPLTGSNQETSSDVSEQKQNIKL